MRDFYRSFKTNTVAYGTQRRKDFPIFAIRDILPSGWYTIFMATIGMVAQAVANVMDGKRADGNYRAIVDPTRAISTYEVVVRGTCHRLKYRQRS